MGASSPPGAIDIWSGFRFDNPAQMGFLRSPARYRLLSSGRGGGKSYLGCYESIRCALDFPESRNMVARLKSTELEKSTHITFRKALRNIGLQKDVHYRYNDNKSTYFWQNGSETVLSHLEDEEKFGSVELSTIFIDEASQVPDGVFQMLFPANLRWEVGPHRAWFCTNPGPYGWLRDIVYGKAKGTMKEYLHEKADGTIERVVDDYEWFPVKPGMNRHNPGGQDYFDDLALQSKRYGPHWKAKYLDGNWDSFEGQRFPDFDHDSHVLASPFSPDTRYEIIEGWDFGHRETFVVWIAYNTKTNEPVVVFDELQVNEVQEPSQVADLVKEKRAKYGIADRVIALGDPAGIGASQFSAVSPISAYAGLGIFIAPCKRGKSPTARADMLNEFLTETRRQTDGSLWPGIVFGPNCVSVVKSVVNLRWKPSTSTLGEDPREQFMKKDDHGFDALGYGLVGVPPPELSEKVIRLPPGVNGPLRPS